MFTHWPLRIAHTAPGQESERTYTTALDFKGAAGSGTNRYIVASPACLTLHCKLSSCRPRIISGAGSAACSSFIFAAIAISSSVSPSGISGWTVRPLSKRWGCMCIHASFFCNSEEGGQTNSSFCSMGDSSSSFFRKPFGQIIVSAVIRAICARKYTSSLPSKKGWVITFDPALPVSSLLIARAATISLGLMSGSFRHSPAKSLVTK
mmetsp:Transcript_104549/g.145689  ORF Transcript_104549/g.145689 Transcript_104549/m.145689 type:complete len:207 (+) Transcript_104549:195-815(+)